MKIAIQGHPTRGKEVIQILKSLGGKNKERLNGSKEYWYFINSDGYIRNDYKSVLQYKGFKTYTLEEFEKEFPFKIGDEVTIVGIPDFPKVITQIIWDCDEILYSFKGLNNTWFGAKSLKKFEMKEERNITLTLDKAKEWYKKGGELKEIALQAYSEEELTKIELPKSWEEFCKQGNPIASWRYNIPTKYEALHKLELLRDCYRGLFVTVIGMPVWCIKRWKGKLIIGQRVWGTNETFLSFQSLKVAEEYLKNFEPLIKQTEDLI